MTTQNLNIKEVKGVTYLLNFMGKEFDREKGNPTHIANNIKSGVHFGDSGSASRFFKVCEQDEIQEDTTSMEEKLEALEELNKFPMDCGHGNTFPYLKE